MYSKPEATPWIALEHPFTTLILDLYRADPEGDKIFLLLLAKLCLSRFDSWLLSNFSRLDYTLQDYKDMIRSEEETYAQELFVAFGYTGLFPPSALFESDKLTEEVRKKLFRDKVVTKFLAEAKETDMFSKDKKDDATPLLKIIQKGMDVR